ncbi:hypothetical protein PGTUg99_002949 [Puccinia graminis f. sp. tritici]|uniref:Uncharacterized protein n=1 Tax=Puccinia graminis f. sp. tritici TaxID=56615 RepID=A0A5B0S4N5_PUCGR|nr:hypothetical protein PGTUg99_002949 [Puccinia graminis f. sp. tritici]
MGLGISGRAAGFSLPLAVYRINPPPLPPPLPRSGFSVARGTDASGDPLPSDPELSAPPNKEPSSSLSSSPDPDDVRCPDHLHPLLNSQSEHVEGQSRSPTLIKSIQASSSRYASGSQDSQMPVSPATISSAETHHCQQLKRLVESEELSATEEDNWHIQQQNMLRQATLEREQIKLANQLEDERKVREEQPNGLSCCSRRLSLRILVPSSPSIPAHQRNIVVPLDHTVQSLQSVNSLALVPASSSLGLFLSCFVSSTIHPPACLSTKINAFIRLLTLVGLFQSDFATSASILPVPESITLIGFHHQHQSDFTCLTSHYHIIQIQQPTETFTSGQPTEVIR